MTRIYKLLERPLLAEDCLPPGLYECLLTRKLTLRIQKSAAIYDPTETLHILQLVPYPPLTIGFINSRTEYPKAVDLVALGVVVHLMFIFKRTMFELMSTQSVGYSISARNVMMIDRYHFGNLFIGREQLVKCFLCIRPTNCVPGISLGCSEKNDIIRK